MKKVLIILAILMVTGTLKAQEKRVITVPKPQVQRPQGFGKQQWQQPDKLSLLFKETIFMDES